VGHGVCFRPRAKPGIAIRRAGTGHRRRFHDRSVGHERIRGTSVGGAARRAKEPHAALQQTPCPTERLAAVRGSGPGFRNQNSGDRSQKMGKDTVAKATSWDHDLSTDICPLTVGPYAPETVG